MACAVVDAFLTVMPLPDMKIYLSPGERLRLPVERCEDVGRGWWAHAAGASIWCLPADLSGEAARMVRVLVLVVDEASTGYMMYMHLATELRARVLFLRDPAHRMSNCFVNTLRCVPRAMQATMAMLVVHKWRRAPFGGGKM